MRWRRLPKWYARTDPSVDSAVRTTSVAPVATPRRRRLRPEHHVAIMLAIIVAGLVLSTVLPNWTVGLPWTVPVMLVIVTVALYLDTFHREWFRGRKR